MAISPEAHDRWPPLGVRGPSLGVVLVVKQYGVAPMVDAGEIPNPKSTFDIGSGASGPGEAPTAGGPRVLTCHYSAIDRTVLTTLLYSVHDRDRAAPRARGGDTWAPEPDFDQSKTTTQTVSVQWLGFAHKSYSCSLRSEARLYAAHTTHIDTGQTVCDDTRDR
jgi:hypothetical protein